MIFRMCFRQKQLGCYLLFIFSCNKFVFNISDVSSKVGSVIFFQQSALQTKRHDTINICTVRKNPPRVVNLFLLICDLIL